MSSESKTPPEPAPAATVVLMREAEGGPFEVFLVKRHGKSKFMANAYVYPGGKLDEADSSDALSYHCRGYLPQALAERLGVDESEALGLHVAALRELFEEAGALYATESNGDEIDFDDESEQERYETYREMLQEGEVDFERIVEWEDLCLRVDALTYFAHWITPDIEPRRYDTRFFLARSPGSQELVHCDRETTDSVWMTPAAAIEAYDGEAFQLAPPTLHTLIQLATFDTIDEVVAHFSEAPIPRVLPKPTSEGSDFILLLPGDADYPVDEATNGQGELIPVEGPTRIVLSGGRWWARTKDD